MLKSLGKKEEETANLNLCRKEVLPSIRRYGCYPPPVTLDIDNALSFTLQMLKLAGIDENLQASFALTQKAKLDPTNAVLYEQGKKLLSAQMWDNNHKLTKVTTIR